MGLNRVWLQTLGDGLVRADQITGIDAHQTPALTGKPARWLLDVVLAVPIGSGRRDDWAITALHRTVIQTPHDPTPAVAALARLLAQLDVINAAGIITATAQRAHGETEAPELATGQSAPTPASSPANIRKDDAERTTGRTETSTVEETANGAAVAGGVRLRFTPFPEPSP